MMLNFGGGSKHAVCRMKNSTGWHPEADSADRPVLTNDTGSVDGRFWDKSTVHEIDAMQREATSALPHNQGDPLHIGKAAPRPETETSRSPASGHESPISVLFQRCLVPRTRSVGSWSEVGRFLTLHDAITRSGCGCPWEWP